MDSGWRWPFRRLQAGYAGHMQRSVLRNRSGLIMQAWHCVLWTPSQHSGRGAQNGPERPASQPSQRRLLLHFVTAVNPHPAQTTTSLAMQREVPTTRAEQLAEGRRCSRAAMPSKSDDGDTPSIHLPDTHTTPRSLKLRPLRTGSASSPSSCTRSPAHSQESTSNVIPRPEIAVLPSRHR